MKIALVGEYFSRNLGDPIIVDSVASIIKEINNDIKIIIIDLDGREKFKSKNTYKIKRKNNIINANILANIRSAKTFLKWIYRDKKRINSYLDRNMKEVDLIIVAGGQMIMNNNLVFPLKLNNLVEYARKRNIPVYFNACGVQKYTKNTLGVSILKKCLNNQIVKYITTRDDIDMLNKYIKEKNKIGRAIDCAVVCDKAYNIEKVSDTKVVGLGVISPEMYKRYYERTKDETYLIDERYLILFWEKLIKELTLKGYEWKMFTNGDLTDYQFAKKILKKLNLEEYKYLEDLPNTPQNLVKLISTYNLIISQRLHSHIIAFALAIPSIGLIWDKKTYDFAQQIQREDLFFNIKDTNVNKILDSIDREYYRLSNINNEIYKDQAIKQIEKVLSHYKEDRN